VRRCPQLTGKQFDLIPHTGVEVYGVEYFFGGGVQALPPATVEATFGLKPCEVLPLGSTSMPKEVFEDFLKEISPRFTSETYNLFTHNCNNFSNELAEFLLGEGIPSRIVDMPQVRDPSNVLSHTLWCGVHSPDCGAVPPVGIPRHPNGRVAPPNV
jgi:hypothetical protein